jgi:hypothetical protein
VKTAKPPELAWAETVIGLAERFHVLPSAVLAEDAGLLRMLNLIDPDCGKADD